MKMLLLILAILSTTTLNAYALAFDIDTNISTNETIDNPVSTTDTIEINETANFSNITENSNETTVIESIIKEEQKKSAGFGLIDSVISLITVMIFMMGTLYIRHNWSLRRVTPGRTIHEEQIQIYRKNMVNGTVR